MNRTSLVKVDVKLAPQALSTEGIIASSVMTAIMIIVVGLFAVLITQNFENKEYKALVNQGLIER